MRLGQADAEAVQTASLNHQPYFAQLRHSPRVAANSGRLFVGFSPTLSSRAEHERPEGFHAESRDPVPPNTSNGPTGNSMYKRPARFIVRTPH